ACADYGLPAKTFARDARAALAAYEWPGNVRELGNVIERVALLADESVITAAMLGLPATTTVDEPPAAQAAKPHTAQDLMRALLLEALTETGWNISQTAVRLGVARNTVLARIARFRLNRSTPARSHANARARREAEPTTPLDVPTPVVASTRPAWEQRRAALV